MSAVFELRARGKDEAILSLPDTRLDALLLFVSDQEDKDSKDHLARLALFDSPNFPEDVPWSDKLPKAAPGGAPASRSRRETEEALDLILELLAKHGAAWEADPDWRRVGIPVAELGEQLREALEEVRGLPEDLRFEGWVTY